jgi:copper chaperone CopZ
MSQRERLTVTAIDCTGCKETILRALQRVDGVQRATADHLSGTVEVLVDGDVSVGDLRATMERLGYDVNP